MRLPERIILSWPIPFTQLTFGFMYIITLTYRILIVFELEISVVTEYIADKNMEYLNI